MTRHVALVGPTATGKSALALDVARRHPDIELVSVDSMQVYRGMDIGTAKPTPGERAEVPHHLVDLADPTENFSLADFAHAAKAALADIGRRGHRALLVGGTGLYVRAVVDDLDVPGRYPHVRAELERDPDTAALHARLTELDPRAAARMEPTNRRRIVRALEVTIGSGTPFSSSGPGLDAYPPSPVGQIGLRLPLDELDRRIETRVHAMVAAGLLDEVRSLPSPLSATAGQALGYRELLATDDVDAAIEQTIRRTRTFARRQLRWFRRDPRITWADSERDAARLLGDWATCG